MLPFPHGSGVGQIAENSFYDTGFTPGSVAGKFIGFGEEGTSAIANRAHWGLSANIDYLYQILAADRSVPLSVNFTASGAPGQNMYQFTGDVFTGDSTYPGTAGASDPAGMLMLFAVLDTNFNEMTDTGGYTVRVKRVRDSTGATDIYKSGFATNPRIYFCTVDSQGLEIDPAYQIPNGTAVLLLYAKKHSMEGIGGSMPTDVFSRYNIMGAHELDGPAFLIDGGRAMKADADWGGWDLDNVTNVVGPATADLSLESVLDLWLKDAQIPGGVRLSEPGVTNLRLNAPYLSLVGELNSKTWANEGLHANRSVVRGGPIYFQSAPPFAGRILFSAGTVVMLNGEAVDIGGRSIYANVGVTECLVLDSSSTLVLKTPSAVVDTDVLLTYHNWSGVNFLPALDCRWYLSKETGNLEITCSTTVADANVTSLSDAVVVIDMYNLVSKAGSSGSQLTRPCVIRVLGDLYDNGTGLTGSPSREYFIHGDGPYETKIYTIGIGTNQSFLSCNDAKLHLKGLEIVYTEAADQNALVAGCVENPGSGSTIENCWIHANSTGKWGNGILHNTGAGRKLDIKDCSIEDCKGCCVDTGGFGSTFIERTYLAAVGTVTACCRLGSRSHVQDSFISGGGTCIGVIFLPNSVGPSLHPLDIHGCYFSSCTDSFYFFDTSNYFPVRVSIRTSTFENCNRLAYVWGWSAGLAQDSTFTFEDNLTYNTAASAAIIEMYDAQNVYVLNNHFYSLSGIAYYGWYRTNTHFIGNYADSVGVGPFGAGNITVQCAGTMSYRNYICNNTLLSNYAAASSGHIFVCNNAVVANNDIEGDDSNTDFGIVANFYSPWDKITIVGNRVRGHVFRNIDVRGIAATARPSHGPSIIGNVCSLTYDSTMGDSIYVDTVGGASIIGNTIGNNNYQLGGGIYLAPASSLGGDTVGCDGASVIGNTFCRVIGYGNGWSGAGPLGTPYLAVLDVSNGNGKGVSVIGNTFYQCGEWFTAPVPTGTVESILRMEAFDSLIEGNTFYQCRGIQDSSCFFYHIWTNYCWRCTIVGNHIRHSMVTGDPVYGNYTTGWMVGIYCDSFRSVVVGNNIAYGGILAAGGPTKVDGISLSSSATDSVVVGNRVSTYDVAAAISKSAIVVGAPRCVVVANNAEAWDIITQGNNCVTNCNLCAAQGSGGVGVVRATGTGGMCLGNVSLGTGGTQPGANATSGNI